MKTTRTLRCFLLFKTLILGACIVLHEDLDDEMYDSFWDRQNKKECPQSLHLGPSTRIPQEWTEDENCFDVNWETPSMVLNACGNINVLSRQSSFCTSFSAHLSSARRKKAECSLRCGLCKHGMLPLAESRCVKSPRCHGMPKKPCEALATSSKKNKNDHNTLLRQPAQPAGRSTNSKTTRCTLETLSTETQRTPNQFWSWPSQFAARKHKALTISTKPLPNKSNDILQTIHISLVPLHNQV